MHEAAFLTRSNGGIELYERTVALLLANVDTTLMLDGALRRFTSRLYLVDLDGDEVDSWTISRSERLVTTRYVVIYRKLDGRCIALMRVDSPF